jgi:tetratricopeptide (TPR) repeat protein
MKCPVCSTVYRPPKVRQLTRAVPGVKVSVSQEGDAEVVSISPPSPTCRRCKADLSDLIRLYDQAIWYHKQALYLLSQGRYSEAAAQNNSAIALDYSNANFHVLAGKLRALQGEFREAIASWQQALKFDPENAIAYNCLQMIQLIDISENECRDVS